ncbi:PD-(D/E)XK nuclease family protein [Clostridium sp. MB40-C1]|uniref:PDDEXK-like family protein n=1 Tax=Clostridium sp. MB40-C1 TaxID=3070996 RepID=UPI0027E0AFED|nr:PD-(D/E)XK nuclease family protein [Clostridium sp. MB40-C1]WMJ81531.1 PD-(D/E)XK nuclease family protein [Clostridium sp. MB40-C1]
MQSEGNIFRVLGLYGKEVVVSNMLAWLLNTNEDHNFGINITNDFLECIGCACIDEKNDVTIYREYYGKKNKKNNFIDIVIVERNKDGKVVHVICIENKVFSSEGDKQTERYWNIIQDDFGNCDCKIECRYLTKNNFPVILSNSHFIHYKYSDLEAVLKKYSTNKIVSDFYESYILQDRIKLSKLEGLTFESYPKYFENEDIQKDLCFYVTQKLVNSLRDICCDISNSAKGGDVFYRAWKQSWNKTIDKINFNIHIEAYAEKVYVHFETLPYIPYKKLDEKTKEIMNRQKEIFMQKLENLQEISGIEKRPIRANATLTIGNFKLRHESFEDYYLIVRNLLDKLDPIITNKSVILDIL